MLISVFANETEGSTCLGSNFQTVGSKLFGLKSAFLLWWGRLKFPRCFFPDVFSKIKIWNSVPQMKIFFIIYYWWIIIGVFWIPGIQHTQFSEYELFHFLSLLLFLLLMFSGKICVVFGNNDFFFFWKNKFSVNYCFEEKKQCGLEFSFLHHRWHYHLKAIILWKIKL